ncbi:TonB-dependent receptor domain-containing protein [Pedobacter sp. NJ-S-72]
MPTFNDLYYTQIGNTFLRPEYTKQYDLGLTYIRAFEGKLLQQVSVQTDAYYNTVKDKIVAVPGANLFRWSMQNIGRVEIKGLDVNVQTAWKITNDLLLNTGLTYTYQQALNVTDVKLNYRNQILISH